jgi:uncharacterized protein YxjI
MRYVMRQRLLSLADSSTIKDENERDAYIVKGKLFSFGDRVTCLGFRSDTTSPHFQS